LDHTSRATERTRAALLRRGGGDGGRLKKGVAGCTFNNKEEQRSKRDTYLQGRRNIFILEKQMIDPTINTPFSFSVSLRPVMVLNWMLVYG